ncbi:OLC1v1019324C1 [Oldenlandia corymbosa var. corymbosa]|uniref:OLC1v1019324C1 n=1 Tax=Oldenlandia corymbosa var. corymbosa TaxID=529605 RepID=A0AAV1EDU2_OLDCO|nr:OLC1v1019324C1 [Oldenlandia corymbosa var. corymbosa]
MASLLHHHENPENPYLSDDILIQILEKLPAKSLLRFKCVCKSWRETIGSPQFARLQIDYSHKLRLNTNEKIFLQINPSCGSMFPQLHYLSNFGSSSNNISLHLISISDNIFRNSSAVRATEENCFSYGNNSIRALQVPSIISGKSVVLSPLKLALATLIVLAWMEVNLNTRYYGFVLASERFMDEILPAPPKVLFLDGFQLEMVHAVFTVSGGLPYLQWTYKYKYHRFEAWVLKEYGNGNNGCWNRMFNCFPDISHQYPFGLIHKDQVLYTRKGRFLYCVDLGTDQNRMTKLKMVITGYGQDDLLFFMTPYVESLIDV